MMDLVLIIVSISAGCLGAILGLGGGIILVPVLTLVFGVDIRYAIAASLVSIVATSSTAAAAFIKDHLTNVRLAIFLELGTVFGALTGFFVASFLNPQFLFILFGLFLLFSALMMQRKREEDTAVTPHAWSDKLKLNSSYPEKGKTVFYNVAQVPFGLVIMYIAGILSAVLGIGSGVFKVLAMDTAMKLPLKVSSATSNFMIGVTAAASAGAYLVKGDIVPEIAAPVVLGVMIGSYVGSKLMPKMPAALIRRIFVVVMVVVSTQMIYKGIFS